MLRQQAQQQLAMTAADIGSQIEGLEFVLGENELFHQRGQKAHQPAEHLRSLRVLGQVLENRFAETDLVRGLALTQRFGHRHTGIQRMHAGANDRHDRLQVTRSGRMPDFAIAAQFEQVFGREEITDTLQLCRRNTAGLRQLRDGDRLIAQMFEQTGFLQHAKQREDDQRVIHPPEPFAGVVELLTERLVHSCS
jgi:hypothetical protein